MEIVNNVRNSARASALNNLILLSENLKKIFLVFIFFPVFTYANDLVITTKNLNQDSNSQVSVPVFELNLKSKKIVEIKKIFLELENFEQGVIKKIYRFELNPALHLR